MQPLLDDMSINTSAMLSDSYGAFSLVMDEYARDPDVPHAVVYALDGHVARELAYFEFAVVGLAFAGETLVALSDWGEVRLFESEETIIEERIAVAHGPLRNVAAIAGGIFACGADQQVYLREGAGVWRDIGPGDAARADFPANHLEMIDGFAPDELYAAGRAGVVWWYDGAEWTPVSCPTNLAFYAVHCGQDDKVYLSGQGGIVAVGRRDSFELFTPPEPLPDIWGVTHWAGMLRMAAFRNLFVWDGERYGVDGQAMSLSESYYDLHVTDSFAWSFGMKDVMRHDGSQWARLGHVDLEVPEDFDDN